MRMQTLLTTLLVSSLFWGLLGCDDDGEGGGLTLTQSGLLSVNPGSILFPTLSEGQSDQREVTLSNQGSADILIQDIRVNQNGNDFTLQYRVGDEDPQDLPEELRINVDGDPIVLIVNYTRSAADLMGDEAVLMNTNAQEQLEVSIPITSTDAVPQILVSPNNGDFGAVDAGEIKLLPLTITNVGTAPLIVDTIQVSGSEDFSVLLSEDGEAISGELDEPIRLMSGENQVVYARYAPMVAGPDQGSITFINNDFQQQEYTLPLIANGAAPCIQVSPETLDFGAGLLVSDREMETPNVIPVSILSCGASPLKVTRIEFEGDMFGLNTEVMPIDEENLILLPAADPDQLLPEQVIEVGFWPTVEMSYGGRMLVYTNTSTEPVEVDLFGRGVENACPIPATTESFLEVPPLEILNLDGSPSVDPGGEVRRWVWTVVERPTGSVSQVVESLTSVLDPAGGGPEDDEETPTATFFVDLAGRYTIELQVYDNLDQVSCEPNSVAQIVIEAIPEKDLHIQLVWSTPEDPDETDNFGTDVDLHFKHANAGDNWGAAAGEWDCYFRQSSPDWGAIGDFLDNPSLDIDDTNGAGPENVNLDRPEEGVSYKVGAIYYRSESTFGESDRDPRTQHATYATVRLFARGELISEFVDRELTELNQLWDVAQINWCEDALRCPEIIEENRVYADGEYVR
jgi:hypothetical protein